jgi:hypothetical protein
MNLHSSLPTKKATHQKISLVPLSFPKDFVWGFAAAAPQIEGASFIDGKGESVWDHFAKKRGKIRHGETLDVPATTISALIPNSV